MPSFTRFVMPPTLFHVRRAACRNTQKRFVSHSFRPLTTSVVIRLDCKLEFPRGSHLLLCLDGKEEQIRRVGENGKNASGCLLKPAPGPFNLMRSSPTHSCVRQRAVRVDNSNSLRESRVNCRVGDSLAVVS